MDLCGYTIHRKVAEGGMGEIFLASRSGIRGFAREVAIKRISPHLARQEAYVQMFLQEARIAALLDHPNVVQVHELVEQDGDYFLVMEYVPGLSLSRALARAPYLVPLTVAVQIVSQVAAGLHFVHEKQDTDGQPLRLVHRDVSPPNILLSKWGGVKLTDFGIAKHRIASALSESGVIKGKYSYLAPEQVRGEPVDRRTDIYSLGLVLYEMTVGCRAYAGEDAQVLRAVEAGRFPVPEQVRPDFPHDLRAVLLRMLSYHREERYDDCKELQRDLVGLLAARGVAPSAELVAGFVRELSAEEPDELPLLEEASPPPLPPVPLNDQQTDPVRGLLSSRQLRRYTLLRELRRGYHLLRRAAQARRREVLVVAAAVALLLVSALIFVWIAGDEPLPGPLAPSIGLEKPVAAPGPRSGSLPAVQGDDSIGPPPVPRRAAPAKRRRHRRHRAAEAGSGEAPAIRQVALVSEPAADVFLGQRKLGRTPLKVTLPRRPVRLLFVNRELALRGQRVLAAGVRRSHLRFRRGKIQLQLKPGLYIKVDGKMVGRTPLPPIPVFEGPHVVTVIDPFRYDKRTHAVVVAPDQVASVP